MQITVLSAVKTQALSKAGKPYTYLELAYKGSDGAVKGKKVMPFGESKIVFDTLAGASTGDLFEVVSVKNEGSGYWDWVGASKSDGSAPAVASAAPRAVGGKVTGSNYETSEERARRQVYIVRQSSITAALSFLNGKAKTTSEVIEKAKEFENYVFSTGEVVTESLADMQDDVPQ